jgi:NADPH:quinone reductase-like Zn-dependent oxidoreductase
MTDCLRGYTRDAHFVTNRQLPSTVSNHKTHSGLSFISGSKTARVELYIHTNAVCPMEVGVMATTTTLHGSMAEAVMPAINQHVVVNRFGGPEVLEVIEDEIPQPGPGTVRVRIIAAGLSGADLLMREGVHPRTPRTPFTPGWDLVGLVDEVGPGVFGLEHGAMVVAMPIWGSHAQYICLKQDELVVVPTGLDPAEALCLVFNYLTAYQMMHRCARVRFGQRVLIHGGSGGIGTALMQLSRVAGLEMFATASQHGLETVRRLGGVSIDYRNVDFVHELRRLAHGGVDAVFDGVGGSHVWQSRKALRPGGKVVVYGFTGRLHGGRYAGVRYPLRGFGAIGLMIAAAFVLPGRKRVLPFSVDRMKQFKPLWFREDLATLFGLLARREIEPIIAERIPLPEIRRAHVLLGQGGVTGRIVLMC